MSKVGEEEPGARTEDEPTRSGLTRTAGLRRPETGIPPVAPRRSSAPPAIGNESDTPRARTSTGTSRSMTISQLARAHLVRMPSDPALDPAADAVLDAVGVDAGTVAIVVEVPHERVGASLTRAAERRGLTVEPYVVDADRLGSEAFVARLANALLDVAGVIYVAGALGVAPPLRAALFRAGGRRRDALLLGLDGRIVLHNLGALSRELEGIAARVEATCKKGRELFVEGLGGTSLRVALGASLPFQHDIGRLDGPGLLVLPAGRTLFCPPNLSGTLAPDGGVLLPGDEVRTAATKLRLTFEQGRLTGAEGPYADRILAAARAVPNGTMVGQVVFGTNPGILTPIGHEGQDLTTPGLHLVLGDSRPEHTGAAFCATRSITLGVRRPDVRVDGEPLLVRGKFARAITGR